MPLPTALTAFPRIAVLALLATASAARTQQPTPPRPAPQPQEELKQRRDAKLARPVFRKANWQFDYDAARALARQDGKAVLAYFTRSWSPSQESDDLENGPLSDPAFVDLAKAFVPFVHCASKVEGEPRPRLMHELGMAVHPTLCFLDAEGKLITQQSELTVGAIVGTGQKVKALIDARTAASKGAAGAEKALFLAELDLDLLTADQIHARLPSIRLDDAEKSSADRKIVDVELLALLRQEGALGHEEVGRRFAAIHQAGRRPNERFARSFWAKLLAHAATTKNGPLADEAYDEIMRREDPNQDPRHALRIREELARMRAEAKRK